MGVLQMNMLPLSLKPANGDAPVAISVRRDEQVTDVIRRGRGSDGFAAVSFGDRSYAWADAVPAIEAVGVDRREHSLGELPAAVVAFALREAVISRLQAIGFERERGRTVEAARLFRRKLNLLKGSGNTAAPNGMGAYPGFALQGIAVSGDPDIPGDVALIVDQYTHHELDLKLPETTQLGVGPVGERVIWSHDDGCGCDETRHGGAGRVVHQTPDGNVRLSEAGQLIENVPSTCLRLVASRHLLVQCVAAATRGNARRIDEALGTAAGEFRHPTARWRYLDRVRKAIGEIEVFPGIWGSLGGPLSVRSGAINGRPTALPTPPDPKLNFRYGSAQLNSAAALGLTKHGPYDEHQPRRSEVRAVVVAPKAFAREAERLKAVLENGVGSFPGMEKRYHLASFTADVHTFADGTCAGYKSACAEVSRDTPDLVFVVIQQSDRHSRRGQNPYLASKALLTGAGVPAQAVTAEKLRGNDSGLQWIADSVSLAAYAKLGNIPFVLHDPDGGRELVLGVGRHDYFDLERGSRRQRFGAAVAFRQDGDFMFAGSTMPVADDGDYEELVTKMVAEAIHRYETEQGGALDRLVVYLFKRTGHREVRAVRSAINGRNIEWALLHVNRDSPLSVVETQGNRADWAPRGTVIAMGERDRLLVTGSHPLRLTLDPASTYRNMDRLIAQAFGMTKTSYRGFKHNNEPSPILYGRLLAEKMSELAPYGLDPALAATKLGNSPWFL